jgi:hypothetical protein
MSDIPSFGNFEIPNNTPVNVNSTQQSQPENTVVPGFYDANEDKGRIVDPKVAEEIAYVEKDQGRDAALKFEEAKRMEQETGLTEDQKYNVELMKVLSEEFPYAFEEAIDERTGEKLLRMRPTQFVDDSNNVASGQTNRFSNEKVSVLTRFNELGSQLRREYERNIRIGFPYKRIQAGTYHFGKDGVWLNQNKPYPMNEILPDEMKPFLDQINLYNEYSRIVNEEANQKNNPEDIRSLIRGMRTPQ